jgi:hypothetical protein
MTLCPPQQARKGMIMVLMADGRARRRWWRRLVLIAKQQRTAHAVFSFSGNTKFLKPPLPVHSRPKPRPSSPPTPFVYSKPRFVLFRLSRDLLPLSLSFCYAVFVMCRSEGEKVGAAVICFVSFRPCERLFR